jgi:GTP-binding protein
MVEAYLRQRPTLRAIVHLVDLRHPPTAQDQQLRAWLQRRDLTVITVATKADQVTHNQRPAHLQAIRQTLRLPIDETLLPFSSHNHEGRLPLWHYLTPFLSPLERSQSGEA